MSILTNNERLILLNLVPEVGSVRLRRLLELFGDLDRLWKASIEELRQVEGIGPSLAQRIAAGRQSSELLDRELTLARQQGVEIVTLEDPGYPQPLRSIFDPPLALYIRGVLVPDDQTAVGIVGARRASLYGAQCAERLGYDLALRGVTIVSGLARGIDGAAHRGALKALGRTLAVLGSGLGRIYPPEHQMLAEQIAGQGALISEYPMELPPLPHNFPRRNRLISGLSLGVIVVEATPRSGALITADCALEQGREVFAVPGPVTAPTSQGTHGLLKQGACLVTSVEDVLEELQLKPVERKTQLEQRSSGSVPSVPELVEPHGKARDNLTSTSQVPVPAVAIDGLGGRHPCLPPGSKQAAHPPVGEDRRASQPRLESDGEIDEQARILRCLDTEEPRHIDHIAAEAGVGVSEVAAALVQLEMRHLIRQLPGKRFLKY